MAQSRVIRRCRGVPPTPSRHRAGTNRFAGVAGHRVHVSLDRVPASRKHVGAAARQSSRVAARARGTRQSHGLHHHHEPAAASDVAKCRGRQHFWRHQSAFFCSVPAFPPKQWQRAVWAGPCLFWCAPKCRGKQKQSCELKRRFGETQWVCDKRTGSFSRETQRVIMDGSSFLVCAGCSPLCQRQSAVRSDSWER